MQIACHIVPPNTAARLVEVSEAFSLVRAPFPPGQHIN